MSPPVVEGRAPPRFTVYLHAGQIFASAKPDVVLTIVGSCVAVCVWEPDVGVGGMNHFLLSQGPLAPPTAGRFANGAIPALIEKLEGLGCRRRRLRAKVFGGACILGSPDKEGGHLGDKNAAAAFELLEDHGIPVVAHDVGGQRGRKIIFEVVSGHVWLRKI